MSYKGIKSEWVVPPYLPLGPKPSVLLMNYILFQYPALELNQSPVFIRNKFCR